MRVTKKRFLVTLFCFYVKGRRSVGQSAAAGLRSASLRLAALRTLPSHFPSCPHYGEVVLRSSYLTSQPCSRCGLRLMASTSRFAELVSGGPLPLHLSAGGQAHRRRLPDASLLLFRFSSHIFPDIVCCSHQSELNIDLPV